MVGIVNYGMGNLLSVYNVFDYLGEDVIFCSEPEQLKEVDRIVIPGVGAFKECMERLTKKNFVEALNEEILFKSKPTLGICLGMQVMAKKSNEGGECLGLGWIDAEVVKIPDQNKSLKVPNIGWNDVTYKSNSILFSNLSQRSDFYFVHSFYMNCKNSENVIATYNYDIEITAAIQEKNIVATQFHPEKSQDNGIQLISNFLKWKP